MQNKICFVVNSKTIQNSVCNFVKLFPLDIIHFVPNIRHIRAWLNGSNSRNGKCLYFISHFFSSVFSFRKKKEISREKKIPSVAHEKNIKV